MCNIFEKSYRVYLPVCKSYTWRAIRNASAVHGRINH